MTEFKEKIKQHKWNGKGRKIGKDKRSFWKWRGDHATWNGENSKMNGEESPLEVCSTQDKTHKLWEHSQITLAEFSYYIISMCKYNRKGTVFIGESALEIKKREG